MSVSIKYKGTEIASASTEVTKTIKTAGKYCEADILVENTPDSGDAPVINPLSVTANGTYTAPSGVDGYSPVTVNVPQGITPSGKITITENGTDIDVAQYALADVNVSGGGGGSSDIITPWYTVKTAEVTIGANSVNNPQTAVSYFEGIYGTGNIIAVFLKDQKATYGTNELVAIPQALSHTAPNVTTAGASLYRMRNNSTASFQGTSGFDCLLYEGSTYAVIYYDTKL